MLNDLKQRYCNFNFSPGVTLCLSGFTWRTSLSLCARRTFTWLALRVTDPHSSGGWFLTDCSPSRGEPTPNQPCGEVGVSFGLTAARVWKFLTAAGLFSVLLFVWRKKTDDWQTFRFFWASCRWWLSSCRQMWDGKTRSEPLRPAQNQNHQLQLSFSLQWL